MRSSLSQWEPLSAERNVLLWKCSRTHRRPEFLRVLIQVQLVAQSTVKPSRKAEPIHPLCGVTFPSCFFSQQTPLLYSFSTVAQHHKPIMDHYLGLGIIKKKAIPVPLQLHSIQREPDLTWNPTCRTEFRNENGINTLKVKSTNTWPCSSHSQLNIQYVCIYVCTSGLCDMRQCNSALQRTHANTEGTRTMNPLRVL